MLFRYSLSCCLKAINFRYTSMKKNKMNLCWFKKVHNKSFTGKKSSLRFTALFRSLIFTFIFVCSCLKNRRRFFPFSCFMIYFEKAKEGFFFFLKMGCWKVDANQFFFSFMSSERKCADDFFFVFFFIIVNVLALWLLIKPEFLLTKFYYNF